MKKQTVFMAAVLAAVALATGCGAKKSEVKTDYVDDLSKYVTLGEYKGLEYEETSTEVTDEDVQAELDYLLESKADVEKIMDGTVADGDTVNIDFTGMRDGVAFDGGSGTGYDLTIGSNSFIDNFEEQLIGMKPGDTKEINVTFPDPYPNNPDLAGVPVVFEVTVNYICGENIIPEMSDQFIADNTDYQTVDEYKEYVRGYLKDYKESTADSDREQALWQQVMDNCTFAELPQDKVDEEVENMYNSYEQYAGYYGLEMADFLEQMGMSEEDFRTELTSYAENLVKRNLVFNAIVEKEGLTVSDDEYEKTAEEKATDYGYESKDAMEETLGADTIREDILWDKVLTLIADNATAKPASDTTDAADTANTTEVVNTDVEAESADTAEEADTADTTGEETPTEATEEE